MIIMIIAVIQNPVENHQLIPVSKTLKGVPADHRVKLKESEKIDKYLDFA